MNDIRLWQLLQSEEPCVEELTALLREMSQQPMERRFPYLGMLERCLDSDQPALSAAAYAMLGGATGYPAWKLFLRGLRHPEAEARQAAFQALHDSATYEPDQWNHVLYHSDAALRTQGLAHVPESFPKHQLLYLLRSPALRQQVVALLRETVLPPGTLPLLFDFVEIRTISIARALHWLAQIPWEQEADRYLLALGEGRAVKPWPETPEELSVRLETLPLYDEDPLDRFNSWLWLAKDSPREQLRARSLQVWEQLHRRWCRGYLDQSLLQRIALSIAYVGFREWDWEPEPLALCARAMPCILAHPEIPLQIRRAAALHLTPANDTATEQDPLAVLLPSDLCLRDDGLLDLRMVGRLLYLVRSHPYEQLLQHVEEDTLLASLLADLSAAPDFLAFSPQSRKEKRLHHSLLTQLLHPEHAPNPALIVELTLRLPVDQLAFLRHLTQWPPELIQEFLSILFAEVQQGRFSERKLDRIARALQEALLPQHLTMLLHSLANTLEEFRVVSAPTQETQVSELERLNPLAIACLGYVGRRVEAEVLAQEIAALPSEEILAILRLEQYCPSFPYDRERTLFRVLREHAAPAVRQAIPYEPEVTSQKQHLSPRQREKVRPLSRAEVNRIATIQDSDLASALLVCFQAPVTGLCDALLARETCEPHEFVCVALLTCADPPEQVTSTFHLFCVEEQFLPSLERAVVRLCGNIEDLLLWGTAWLYRWDKHHDAFITHLLSQFNDVMESLQWSLRLASPVLVQHFWQAVSRMLSRWRWHQKQRLQEVVPEQIVEFLVDLLLPPKHRAAVAQESPPAWALHAVSEEIQEEAARMLAVLRKTGMYHATLAPERERLLPHLPHLPEQVQLILRDWLNSQGMNIRQKQSLASLEAVDPALLQEIRKNFIPRTLAQYCRDRRRVVVEEAASQLVTLGAEGNRILLELLLEQPALPHLRCLTETIALWEDTSCLRAIQSVIPDYSDDPERRFLLASAMCERGDAAYWPTVVGALHQPVEEDWFTGDDWLQLQRLEPKPRELAISLICSPLYGVYSRALTQLLSFEYIWDDALQQALIQFLQCGDERPLPYRLRVARRLHQRRCWEGLPLLITDVLCKHTGQQKKEDDRWKSLWAHVPEEYVWYGVQAALLAGEQHMLWPPLLKSLTHPDIHPDAQQRALLAILRTTHYAHVQQEALRSLRPSARRRHVLQKLAETLAWGMQRGRELTGKLFRIEMIGGDQFGYTRLTESRIFVNPLPLLRGERNGQPILKGLILHELGHHIYHADPESQDIWRQAHKENIGSLLNLVSDEQLERSLRAKDPTFGNYLKRLAAYAFQHNDRDMHFSELLELLGVQAFPVLHQTPLRPSRRPRHVVLSLGKLFFALEASGYSFPRFVRALRMGLGNRHNDPKVAQALQLFDRKFRHSTMSEMLQISYRLREIFGKECDLLQALSQDTVWTGASTEEIVAVGEGLTQEEVQREVDRVLRGRPEHDRHNDGGTRTINLTEETSFSLIHNIVPLVHDPSAYRTYRQQVKRWSSKMRNYLRHLGLGTVPQRRRLSGYRLDTPALPGALLRGDPRILMARKTVPKTDLFVGILVDCSGSMTINNNIERAKLFATMLAEAAAPMSDVDARFFGFTDTELYDAGDAKRCAVHALEAGGGNNDAAALWHAAQIAQASRRRAKLLIMISDGSPTECSVAALRELVKRLTERMNICCAQVAVQPLDEICFPHYIELTEANLDLAIHRFGTILAGLVRKAMNM